MVGFLFLAVVIPPVFQFLSKHLTAITDFLTSMSTTTLYLSGAATCIIIYLISWMVSQSVYQRKVF